LVGGAHKVTRGLLGVVAACFCLLALAPASAADRSRTIHRLRADAANLAGKKRSAVLGLYSLESQLSVARTRLVTLEVETRRLQTERASIRHQLRLARLDARLSQSRLASRLRYLYDHGSTSALEVLLGASSLDDVMTQLDEVNRVVAANQDVLAQVQSAQGHLLRLSHALTARGQALAAATREAAATAAGLGQARVTRAAYIAQLTRRRALDSAQIERLDAQARAAETLSLRLTRSATGAAVTEPSAFTLALVTPQTVPASLSGSRKLTVIATGYGLAGRTSTGLPVGWGVAAVDPSVIPLGTHLTIPGYGEAIAADTGPSVRGSTIDLWFPTVAQAYAWGRRSITIALH
jgi:3D (Asp-Asp-Asp) domain-containing protein